MRLKSGQRRRRGRQRCAAGTRPGPRAIHQQYLRAPGTPTGQVGRVGGGGGGGGAARSQQQGQSEDGIRVYQVDNSCPARRQAGHLACGAPCNGSDLPGRIPPALGHAGHNQGNLLDIGRPLSCPEECGKQSARESSSTSEHALLSPQNCSDARIPVYSLIAAAALDCDRARRRPPWAAGAEPTRPPAYGSERRHRGGPCAAVGGGGGGLGRRRSLDCPAFGSKQWWPRAGSSCTTVDGATVDSVDMQGCTPLMYAAEYGHLEVAHALISAGSPGRQRPPSRALLWLASAVFCNWGRAPVVTLLLEAGSDVHSVDGCGRSPQCFG